MSSNTTQRFVTLAIIVTLSLSVWSGYLYSQTYKLSQDSSLRLAEAGRSLEEVNILVHEANSKLDAANKISSEGNRKLEEANKLLKETEDLLKEIRLHGIAYITSITVEQKPEIHYLTGELLLTVRLNFNASSLSRFPVYYEDKIIDTTESSINISGQTYSFDEFAKTTSAQTDLETPHWSDRPKTLGTDTPQVAVWIGLRGFAFQRQGIVLADPKENMTIGVDLKLQLIQAHTNLVMERTAIHLDFELRPEGQTSVRMLEWEPKPAPP